MITANGKDYPCSMELTLDLIGGKGQGLLVYLQVPPQVEYSLTPAGYPADRSWGENRPIPGI